MLPRTWMLRRVPTCAAAFYPVDEDMEDNSCRLATMRMAASGAGDQFLDLVVTSSHLHSLKDLLIMTIYTKFWAMVLVSRGLQERVK